ncbi:MAG: bacterial Ig-like domain-containing protein [Treponema sp.]|jgi:hypothetical protein|nr:bacterial Ig-like domain-containing protein [Treponema sp.]
MKIQRQAIGILAVIALLFAFTACKDGDDGNKGNENKKPTSDITDITAIYYAGPTIYPTTPLNDLKADLTVTATRDNGTTTEVDAADYTLSVSDGALVEGINIVTVSYKEKTTTFAVVVSTPEKPVKSISAEYTQGNIVVYPATPLNSLKPGLTVTVTYEDDTTGTLFAADYTLSGTLIVGTSTVIVEYQGKSDTFTVTVSTPLAAGVLFSLSEWLKDPPPNFASSNSPRPLAKSGTTCIPSFVVENDVNVAIKIPARHVSEPWHGLNLWINDSGGGSSNHGFALNLDCVTNIYEMTVEGYIIDAPPEGLVIQVTDELDTIFKVSSDPLPAGETFTIVFDIPEDARAQGPDYGNPNTQIRIRADLVNYVNEFAVTGIVIKDKGPR